MHRCANCGGYAEPKLALCSECFPNKTDGSKENIAAWYAWSTLINGNWNTFEMEAFADSPAVQKFLKELIEYMPERLKFITKEAKKLI